MDNTLPPQVAAPVMAEKLPSVGELLRQAWAVYKQRFWTLIGISVIPVAVMIAGMLAGAGLYVGIRTVPGNEVAAGGAAIVIGLAFLAVLVAVSVWSQVAALWNLNNPGQDPGFKASFSNSRSKILPFFFTSLLAGLAVIGGFILLIIPGIIFALWFSQSAYTVITENLSGVAALKQSKKYVAGRLGPVFWRYLAIGLIAIAISLATTWIGGMFNNQEAAAILNNLVSFALGPLVAAYGFALFYHLKRTAIQ